MEELRGKELLLKHRWFDRFYLIFLPVLLAPLPAGILLFFMNQKTNVPTILYLAFACLLVLAYCTLAIYLNSSYLYSQGGSLSLECGPLPWPSKSLELREGAYFKGGTTRRGTSSTHHKLWLATPDGESKLVLSGFTTEQVCAWADLLNEKLSLC